MNPVGKLLFSLIAVASFNLQAQEQAKSPWHIQAENIDPNNCYGVAVATGMVGLVSSAEPMKIKDVVLNGVYDNYQNGIK